MKIVVAPNAFKNSLSAQEAANAIREGLLLGGFLGEIICQPVGDGGDGTGKILCTSFSASTIRVEVLDPFRRKINASIGWIPATQTGIIEMADASGLRLLNNSEYNPLIATTVGCGQLIKKALDMGAKEILFCVGGSATVDGGAGILQELGVVFKDESGLPIEQLPLGLMHLQSIEGSQVDARLKHIRIVTICDVRNRLLGKNGAAAIFGPQKGASPSDVYFLDKALSKFSVVIKKTTGISIEELEGGGAGGGVPAGLTAFANVSIVQGSNYILDRIGFSKVLKKADVVITGEGAIDLQTLEGKASYAVAQMAKTRGINVIGVAGNIPKEPNEELNRYFDTLISINRKRAPLEEAIRHTKQNLIIIGRDIANNLVDRKYKY